MAIEVNESNFEETVLGQGTVALVDFWAEWCGPCRMVGPIVEEVSKEYEGKATIVKCDVDSAPEISVKYGIRNIPTLLFFKDGEIADKLVGAVQKSKITEKLDALL